MRLKDKLHAEVIDVLFHYAFLVDGIEESVSRIRLEGLYRGELDSKGLNL